MKQVQEFKQQRVTVKVECENKYEREANCWAIRALVNEKEQPRVLHENFLVRLRCMEEKVEDKSGTDGLPWISDGMKE